MKNIFFSATLLLLISLALSMAQEDDSRGKSGTLLVIIAGAKSDQGTLKIGLFVDSESYQGKRNKFRGEILPIKNKAAKWEVKNLPYGVYAIKAFHDEDNDDEVDTNFLGMPTEKYGFSNNARSWFGMPTFDKAKFVFDRDSMSVEIELR